MSLEPKCSAIIYAYPGTKTIEIYFSKKIDEDFVGLFMEKVFQHPLPHLYAYHHSRKS
jgi:predicted SprT family Zn-dependent metalloprotease